MLPTFIEILRSPGDEQRSLFEAAASGLKTRAENVEKDLYVCWVLDFLFNRRKEASIGLYFKGGTSLSKAYGLISRFSEDIDIGLYKSDLGVLLEKDIEALGSVTKQQKALADEVDSAARQYISGPLRDMLTTELKEVEEAVARKGHFSLSFGYDAIRDKEMHDILLVGYRSVFDNTGGYVEAAVRIEGGARPDPVPAEARTIIPYIASELQADPPPSWRM
jgi:hypothetical protein